MSRTSRKADIRRDEILKGAAACINEKGVRGAGIADICERVGISPGHLYYYFKSKEAIILALVEQYRDQALAHLREIAERADALDYLLSADFFEDNKCAPAGQLDMPILWELYGEAARSSGPVIDMLKLHWVDGQEMVLEVLERARSQGRLRPDADLDVMRIHFSMYLATSQLASLVEPDFDLGRYQRTVRAAFSPYLAD